MDSAVIEKVSDINFATLRGYYQRRFIVYYIINGHIFMQKGLAEYKDSIDFLKSDIACELKNWKQVMEIFAVLRKF